MEPKNKTRPGFLPTGSRFAFDLIVIINLNQFNDRPQKSALNVGREADGQMKNP
jgi:hypothetical protein